MQPRIVATDSSMVASETTWAMFNPVILFRLIMSVIAAGTYTDPAHNPMIETSTYSEFAIVRLRYSAENKTASGRTIDHVCTTCALFSQRFGSFTPYRIKLTSSAGNPPIANIHRQP